ncbi:glutaredoxin-like protein NrdH [Aerococcus agrisoli]|uniref:Glutaredoxin-like protein NrdH n=1 Tax=Aerococcus agrisoli TaxID=2487350 RepID=A0A3N4GQ60_9LACT|nr:glutaredoxin-like protein NrdH [Aerococcus agrisoli]RPA65049.1 glutaredoxin-like protein NrdH [Aerococcus agrisoli]
MTPIIYSKNDCMQCNFTKKYLSERGIEFIEKNVEENEQYREEVKGMGYKSVPVIITANETWTGFQPDKLAKLVE